MMEEESNPFASVQGNAFLHEQSNGAISQEASHNAPTTKTVPLASSDPLNAIQTHTDNSQIDTNIQSSKLNKSSSNLPRVSTDSNNSDPQTPSSPRENKVDDDDLPLINGMKPDAKYRQQLQEAHVHSDTSFKVPAQGVMPFFEVQVTSPRKVNDAINPYTVYKVITKVRDCLNAITFRQTPQHSGNVSLA